MSYTHPSQSSHPVHAINPWPLDAILLPHRKAAETPLDRLYIMYHYIVRGDYNVLRNEVQDFFDHHAWKVYDIPDPHDNDPERYAILAIVTQYLAHGFNRRIKIGGQSRRWKPTDMEIAAHTFFRGTRNLPWQETLEREPKWAKDVPKVPVALVLSKGSWYFPGQRGKSSRFGGKGVVAEEIIECFI
ncbi:hypothetical protein EJ02DRAFT_335463 [Clathrospora elynae]|uniref:Uncharacterized protein n=1 Tax=Clathrospora elynae TaxID=706981 RepID=A0A6A5TD58_9PLEO|nr:hypothetical protein EJ02DRAFT_335463 [Clathrospora elynae]